MKYISNGVASVTCNGKQFSADAGGVIDVHDNSISDEDAKSHGLTVYVEPATVVDVIVDEPATVVDVTVDEPATVVDVIVDEPATVVDVIVDEPATVTVDEQLNRLQKRLNRKGR